MCVLGDPGERGPRGLTGIYMTLSKILKLSHEYLLLSRDKHSDLSKDLYEDCWSPGTPFT